MPRADPMECFAFCSAASYQIKSIYEQLKTIHLASIYRDVVHIEFSLNGKIVNGFFFAYGASVIWGATKEECLNILKLLVPYESETGKDLEIDEFTYSYEDIARVQDDEIFLPDTLPLTKLALSYAIAQSVKLGTFETSILKAFNSNKHLPEDLATKGKIFLSRKEIRKKMGKLFIERNSINMHLDVLDAPEFFWKHTELEPLYRIMYLYLDIGTRVDALNQRLDVLHELFQMLGNELNHQHSSRLEITIILLIVIEVLLLLAKDFFKII